MTPWVGYVVVFVASACTLVLEIAAGRLLAPYIGASLYTWTSVIGVVLAGISLGNYLGGVVADRAGSRRTLGLVLVAGGLASLAVLPFTATDLIGLVPRGLPPVARIVLLTGLLFFVPSAVLGMVSPVVVKLTLADLAARRPRRRPHLRVVDARQHRRDVPDRLRADSLARHEARHLRRGRDPGRPRGGDGRVLPPGRPAAGRGRRVRAPPDPRAGADPPARGPPPVLPPGDELLLHPGDHRARGRRPRVPGACRSTASSTATTRSRSRRGCTTATSGPTPSSRPTPRSGSPRLRALFVGGGGYTLPRYMEVTYPDADARGGRDRPRGHPDGGRADGPEPAHAGDLPTTPTPARSSRRSRARRPTISSSGTRSTTFRSRTTSRPASSPRRSATC